MKDDESEDQEDTTENIDWSPYLDTTFIQQPDSLEAFSAAANAFCPTGERQLVTHGGKGSGNFGHAGRPGQRGGSSPSGSEEKPEDSGAEKMPHLDEFQKSAQERIQKMEQDVKEHPLTRPVVMLGAGDLLVSEHQISLYLETHGREWKAKANLPDDQMGPMKKCYKNATLLSLQNKDYSYCEGLAFTPKLPGFFGFLHGWVVDKEGNVLDPTFKDADKCKYFGVKYDKKEYMKYLTKTRKYGVLGGDEIASKKLIEGGGSKMIVNANEIDERSSPIDQEIPPSVLEVIRGWITQNSLVIHGGPGSGNFGHAGRPGEVGGSAPLQSPPFSQGTMAKYQRKDGSWKPEREPIHKAVFDFFKSKVTDQDKGRVLYMTGGGFGSGKSTLLERFPEHVGFPTKDKVAVADPDAAKQFIPEMHSRSVMGDRGAASYVHEESSWLAKQAVKQELKAGHSVIYDTSGDSSLDQLHDKVQGYRDLGAVKVIANYATPLSTEEAFRRAESRAAKTQEGFARRELTRTQVEVNHREVSRCWMACAKKGTFDELGLWSTAGHFGSPPEKIAEARGGKITVHNKEAFKKFVDMGK